MNNRFSKPKITQETILVTLIIIRLEFEAVDSFHFVMNNIPLGEATIDETSWLIFINEPLSKGCELCRIELTHQPIKLQYCFHALASRITINIDR